MSLVTKQESQVVVRTNGSPQLDVSEVYRLAFPYKRLDTDKQRTMVEITERILELKSEIENYSVFDCFDAVLYSLRHIQEHYPIPFNRQTFVDAMSYCGAASFYAASYDLKSVVGIEFTYCGYNKAEQLRQTLFPSINSTSSISFKHGTFQDFLPYDADIVFLDCTIVGTDSMLDEGVLLKSLFFPMCMNLLSGTFLIVVTASMTLHTEDCVNMLFPFECVDSKPLQSHNENVSMEEAEKHPKQVWILRTTRSPHK